MATDTVEEGLLRGAEETLRPILRRMIRDGVPYPVFEERLRELAVRIAEEEFTLPGRRQTLSRVALLTGLNRKQVRRIREHRKNRSDRSTPSVFSRTLATTLISHWMNDSEATDGQGRPVPIPYHADDGPSFVRFARKATGDFAPRAILDELVRMGVAETRPDDAVALATDSYVPRAGSEKISMLAEDPPELIETMLHNIFSEGDTPWLQRKVFQDNVGARGIERVRKQLRREGERFLRRMVRLLAGYDQDRNRKAPKGEPRYVSVGLYYFEKPGIRGRRTPSSTSGERRRKTKRRHKEKVS